jgi:hypothetical protein
MDKRATKKAKILSQSTKPTKTTKITGKVINTISTRSKTSQRTKKATPAEKMAPKKKSAPVTTTRTRPVRVILRPGTLTNSKITPADSKNTAVSSKTTAVSSKTTAVSSKTPTASLEIPFAGPKFSRKLVPPSHGAHSGERDSQEPDDTQSNSDLSVCTYFFFVFFCSA